MRIQRADDLYSLPLDLAELAKPEADGGIAAQDPEAYRDVPLAALPALLYVNPIENRRLRPDELPTRTLAREAVAFVNDGRWVAECPTPGCTSALVVSPTDPRFLCPVCWQGWYPVRFPADARVAKIEAVLSERPAPQTRHWLPGETVADLAAENAENLGGGDDDPPPVAWTGRRR